MKTPAGTYECPTCGARFVSYIPCWAACTHKNSAQHNKAPARMKRIGRVLRDDEPLNTEFKGGRVVARA